MPTTHGELFAGISGFGLGFSRAGIETLWHVEIDEKCQAVLRRHYPDTLLLSDVRNCGAHNLLPVDIISFGSPCQDLSIAGKRKGLIDGEKSNLFFEAIRIVNELKPTFGVWENVLGAFSTNSGRDFAAVLAAFQNIGARDIAWTCLDAQYFGVAQRRRRVFLVADFRRERAAQVLFEPESCERRSAPSRETGARVAAPLTRGSATGRGVNEPGRRREDDVNLVAPTPTAPDPNAPMRNGKRQDGSRTDKIPIVISRPLAYGSTTDHYDESQQSYVVAQAFNWQSGGDVRLAISDIPTALGTTQVPAIAFTERTRQGESNASAQEADPGKVLPVLRREIGEEAFTEWGLGVLDSLQQAEILRPNMHGTSLRGETENGRSGMDDCSLSRTEDSSTGSVFEMWLSQRLRRTSQEWGLEGQFARELGAYLSQLSQQGASQAIALHHLWQASEGLRLLRQALSEIQEVWRSEASESQPVQSSYGVRRLTPLEAERLQGFPDCWTEGEGQSDSARYRQLGNAVAVPVAQWIGQRILAADNEQLDT